MEKPEKLFSRVNALQSKLALHGILVSDEDSNSHVICRPSTVFDMQRQILLANTDVSRANIESVVLSAQAAREMERERERDVGDGVALVAADGSSNVGAAEVHGDSSNGFFTGGAGRGGQQQRQP